MQKSIFLFVAISLFSCHSTPQKETQKIDTVLIAAQGPSGPFFDSAIRVVGRVRAFKDSTSLDGKMVDYTAYRMGQLTDTVRDSLRRPRLDRAGHFLIHLSYPLTYLDTTSNKYIRVISFSTR